MSLATGHQCMHMRITPSIVQILQQHNPTHEIAHHGWVPQQVKDLRGRVDINYVTLPIRTVIEKTIAPKNGDKRPCWLVWPHMWYEESIQ
jgi:hypothetical protein